EVRPVEAKARLRQDPLHGPSVPELETGPESLVPADHLVEGLLQGRGVKRLTGGHDGTLVVDRAVGIELLCKPQPLLHGGEGILPLSRAQDFRDGTGALHGSFSSRSAWLAGAPTGRFRAGRRPGPISSDSGRR